MVLAPEQEQVRPAIAALLGGFPVGEQPGNISRGAAESAEEAAEKPADRLPGLDRGGGYGAKILVSGAIVVRGTVLTRCQYW